MLAVFVYVREFLLPCCCLSQRTARKTRSSKGGVIRQMTHLEAQLAPPTPALSSKRTRSNSSQASAQSISLADVLQMAPRLGELLHPSTIKPLLSTSRPLRCAVCAYVSSVSIHLDTGTQHQLRELQVLTGGSWPRLQHLKLETGRLNTLAITQLSSVCSSLTSLDLSCNSLDAEDMSQLVLGNWPALKSLNLSHNKLNVTAIAQLAQANWPLEELQLADNAIGVQAIQKLVQGNHFQLKQLSLSWNVLSTNSIRVLITAQWPVRQLDLSQTVLTVDGIAQLAKADWPLEELQLTNNGICAEGMKMLVLGNWPKLHRLMLADIKPGYEFFRFLVRARWPLRELDLGNISITGPMGLQHWLDSTYRRWPDLVFRHC